MQFHEYRTLRAHWAQQTHDSRMRKVAKEKSSDEFRQLILKVSTQRLNDEMTRPGTLDEWEKSQMFRQLQIARTEQKWVELGRPFYNVWPLAVVISKSVRLDLRLRDLEFEFEAILLRFAVGHAPHEVGTAMLHWEKDIRSVAFDCWFAGTADAIRLQFNKYDPDTIVEEWLETALKEKFESTWVTKKLSLQ